MFHTSLKRHQFFFSQAYLFQDTHNNTTLRNSSQTLKQGKSQKWGLYHKLCKITEDCSHEFTKRNVKLRGQKLNLIAPYRKVEQLDGMKKNSRKNTSNMSGTVWTANTSMTSFIEYKNK